MSALRAIETRRTIMRAANTGISAFFDPLGNACQKTKYETRAAISQTVYPNKKLTFYTKHGDYLARIMIGIAILMVIFTILKKYKFFYKLSAWFYSLQEKNTQLSRMVQMSKYIEEENYFAIQPDKFNMIHFSDDKGTLRLAIKFHNLYYIESSDNYVNIYYENKGKITRFLLRRSLKSIEESYVDYPLVRCHRSYIVNVNKVKVLRKDKEGILLDLDEHNLPDIPVSKTYAEQVIKLFYQ
jgi:DNA-binding LytR/AlgR family response regulator